jgi:hypothetical protein
VSCGVERHTVRRQGRSAAETATAPACIALPRRNPVPRAAACGPARGNEDSPTLPLPQKLSALGPPILARKPPSAASDFEAASLLPPLPSRGLHHSSHTQQPGHPPLLSSSAPAPKPLTSQPGQAQQAGGDGRADDAADLAA